MNRKELIKFFLLVCAILSTSLIIVADSNGQMGIIILFLILFIFSLPIAYLYKYKDFKKSNYKKLLNIGVIIVLISLLIFLGYLLASDFYTTTVSSFDVNTGNSYNELDLSLGYVSSENFGNVSIIIIPIYIILLFTLLLISSDDLLIKTNKNNYILTIVTSIIIIIVNICYFNPYLRVINNISYESSFNFVRQFDIYFVLLLGLTISHKFINKEKDA